MTRATSAQTYHAIEASGLLSQQRWEAYAALYIVGPATGSEVSDAIPGSIVNNVRTRLSELRDRGVAEEYGTRKCSITGQDVILWRTTDRLPVDPGPRDKSADAQEIARLRLELSKANQRIIELGGRELARSDGNLFDV
jgi:hypothetical protein